MIDFFSRLFDTTDFPPRWHCGNWSEFLGWLHVGSDLATWAAYFTIPVALIYFARKRKDFPFTRLFWLFAAFILACGTVHLIEAIIFWHPIYRVSALVKFVTAVVSWVTVFALLKIIPSAMHLPSLATTNARLRKEVRQREETERELRAAKARYEALLSGTRSIVWTTDPEGNFVTPQVSWERFTGQTWDQHKGTGWIDAVQKDDQPELLRRWTEARAALTKYQASGRLWNHDRQSWRAFVADAVPVFSADGTVTEWVGTVSDVEVEQQALTSLGLAQSEVAKQNRELELIYEAAPVGMSLIDPDYKYVRINATLAVINGFPREYHIGRQMHEIMPELAVQVLPWYKSVFETGQPALDIEVVGKTAATEYERTWLVSYYPLITGSTDITLTGPSTVSAVSSIVQDITDRKLQEQRLKDSEQAALAASKSKSEFLANMSHEIRTPMAAILGYADVLLGHLDDPDNRNCVLIIKKNGDYLLELINDILDLSRIEANKFEVDIISVNLLQLVDGLRSLMQVRASEKQLELTLRFETPVPQTIKTDQTRLRQVLINLLGNAIKFTETGSVTFAIRIVRESHAAMVFTVTDTGIGMSDEQQRCLFKPFSQGDASVTREYGGSGLGLAISHRLAGMLGGSLSAESTLGQGSTFRLTLPVDLTGDTVMIQPDMDNRSPDQNQIASKPRRLDCRVLVVDDRRDVRHISQHFLEKAGAAVSTAEDGQQGLDAALAARDSGAPFDLIVMDMQMPNKDGLQATAELRSAGVHCPIIALTADAMKGDRERCLNGGCDDYLSKPIDQAELVEMVGRYTQDVTINELRQGRTERATALNTRLGEQK